jgi:hypothetical protein
VDVPVQSRRGVSYDEKARQLSPRADGERVSAKSLQESFGLYSTGIAPWNSPRFVVALRFKNDSSEFLEEICLLFSPFALLSQAAFGFSTLSRHLFLSKKTHALHSLFAHLPRFSPASPAEFSCPCSTKASSFGSSLKLRTLQHHSERETLLFTVSGV